MPSNSVNTNVGAMVALPNLNSTNADLAVTQGRINTGKRINNAKDNGAIWAIAQNQRATSQSLNAVREEDLRKQRILIQIVRDVIDEVVQAMAKTLKTEAARGAPLTTQRVNEFSTSFGRYQRN